MNEKGMPSAFHVAGGWRDSKMMWNVFDHMGKPVSEFGEDEQAVRKLCETMLADASK